MKFMKSMVVILLIFTNGCLFFQDVSREGFKEEDLRAPLPYAFYMVEKPHSSAFPPIIPVFKLYYKVPPLYKNYRGSFWIDIENTGKSDIFVYGLAIKIDGNEQKSIFHGGKKISQGEKEHFVLSFECPGEGNHTYQLGVYYMAGLRGRWYDHGLRYMEEKREMKVEGYQSGGYKLYKNYYKDFDKINNLIDTNDVEVVEKTNEITSSYGSSYNVAKMCAIFEWIYLNIPYVNDTENEWHTPSYVLSNGGDCEEFAMLMASMITIAGGTARVYLTDNHAFAAVYIGKDLSLLKNIDSYYNANLSYAFFKDEMGYWLVADPLSSFRIGFLPVGGIVKGGGGKYYSWSIITNDLYSIDVMKD